MALDLFSCIKSFVAVIHHNGFASAARHSHISTPVLTKQIKWLEEYLGKQLLHRTTRRLQLTEAGKVYLPEAMKILQQVNESQAAILELDTEPHGIVTLGFPSIFDSMFPVHQLKTFLMQYPKIKLSVIAENTPNALLTGQADLVISTVDTTDKQFIKDHLLTSRRGIYAAPEYIKKHGVPKKITELTKFNCLVNKRVFPTSEWTFANHKKIKVSGNYESDLVMDTFFAAVDGLGLICAPINMVETEIKMKRLITIQLDTEPTPVDLYLYYLPQNYSTHVKLMADYLKQHAQCCRDRFG